ncbi:MAG: HD domain-containing protein [Acidobacteria bacterium]|nr:HD domain-containing protein [Acidobacteriota bacterium]
MPKLNYRSAEERARELLKQLDKYVFPFHNRDHTFVSVLSAIDALAAREGIEGEKLELLRTAGLYHDVGFVERYWDNEEIGARIAERELPAFGYTASQIEVIKELILATKMPQKPKDHLGEIICDADLFNLGGEEFWVASWNLLWERILHKTEIPVPYKPPLAFPEWLVRQLEFQIGHKYFTKSARDLRDSGKQTNIAYLEQVIEVLEPLYKL